MQGHHDHDPEAGAADHADQHDRSDHGHDKHAGHDPGMFRDRFWSTLALGVVVVYFSDAVQGWFGYEAPTFTGSDWIAPMLGTVIFVYGGSPFLTGALREIRDRAPGMMLLIGMAITVAFVASAATTIGWFDLEFWWELAALIVVMLLGHWMEMRAIGQARGALAALAELIPDEAERVAEGGRTETIEVSDLEVGDVVLVRPGGRVPADGEIVDGGAEMDESMITGESKPVHRTEGDTVVAGTVATDSAIRVRVDAVGDETALAGIQRLVAEAQQSRSRAQALADRAAAMLFYVAVGAAVITVIVWVTIGRTDDAVARSVAVLVIACPHALGLAIPLVISISTSMAARNGILVKDRLALERMRTVDVVLFDKTGTLTRGEHTVTGVAAVSDEDEVLRLAAAAEADSEHPLARAIVQAARERGDVPTASDFAAMSGRGIEATVEGRVVTVGGPRLAAEREWDVGAIEDTTSHWSDRGAAVLHVAVDGTVVGAIALEDEIRPESRRAIELLHESGIRVAMITGDAEQVARAVAADLGIDEVLAEIVPEDKHSKVAELQGRGDRVAMVGDGVNDAPALAQADVGIAIGAGTDVAIESAGIVLGSDDPRAVVSVRRLSRAGYRKMIQNLWWAAGYNIVAIPLAAGVLAWSGFVLPPAGAAVLMSASTVIVALNAQLLRGTQLSID